MITSFFDSSSLMLELEVHFNSWSAPSLPAIEGEMATASMAQVPWLIHAAIEITEVIFVWMGNGGIASPHPPDELAGSTMIPMMDG
jgi:hypothetical protein